MDRDFGALWEPLGALLTAALPSKDLQGSKIALKAQKQLKNIHDEKIEKQEQIDEADDMFSENFDTSTCDNSVFKAKTDNATDAEGYYRVQLGESLHNNNYVVYAYTGQGVFSNVVRVHFRGRAKDARQEKATKAVVKIIRKNDVMHRAAIKEMKIVNILNNKDVNDKYHVLRFFDKFHKKIKQGNDMVTKKMF